MIALLNTSTPTCYLTLVDDAGGRHEHTWEAGRNLARDGLAFVRDCLAKHDSSLSALTGLGVFRGPGSFTGLRIGITIWNTIASAGAVPIVGVTGEDWQQQALDMLAAGHDDQIVLPQYGGEATITTPRK